MSFKDSFNRLVTEVEKLVGYDEEHGYLKANEIIDILRNQEGKSARDLNTIFGYVSGNITLNRYIKDRKMMATYRKMVKDNDYDIQSYIDCSGYDNESSFSTAFSEKFGVPPKRAYQQKDETKIEAPISIDSLMSKANDSNTTCASMDKVFGLPKDIIDKYNEICELQALFGFKDEYVELAVFLNDEKCINLQDAFNTVDSFVMDYDSLLHLQSLEEMIDYINKEVSVVYVKHLYPDVCLPELNKWFLYMKKDGGNVLEESPEFVRAFFDNVSDGFSYIELKTLYNDYMENHAREDTFMGFLETIQEYGSIEAFDEFMSSLQEDWKQ